MQIIRLAEDSPNHQQDLFERVVAPRLKEIIFVGNDKPGARYRMTRLVGVFPRYQNDLFNFLVNNHNRFFDYNCAPFYRFSDYRYGSFNIQTYPFKSVGEVFGNKHLIEVTSLEAARNYFEKLKSKLWLSEVARVLAQGQRQAQGGSCYLFKLPDAVLAKIAAMSADPDDLYSNSEREVLVERCLEKSKRISSDAEPRSADSEVDGSSELTRKVTSP